MINNELLIINTHKHLYYQELATEDFLYPLSIRGKFLKKIERNKHSTK